MRQFVFGKSYRVIGVVFISNSNGESIYGNVVAAVAVVTPVAITCVTFDNGIQGSNGASLAVSNVLIRNTDTNGIMAVFNGYSSKIKVLSLADTYRYDLY